MSSRTNALSFVVNLHFKSRAANRPPGTIVVHIQEPAMATEMTKFEKTKEKFPRNATVQFTAGRGHKYVGKVKSVEDDSYLNVSFTNTKGKRVERRISSKNARITRAKATA